MRISKSLKTASRCFSSVNAKPLNILGLESSADDTCAAVLSGRKILSNVVIKQPFHEKWGGIHPLHAQEAHQANMGVAIQRALSESGLKLDQMDGIAFTRGPGMYGCLSVCAASAKALAGATGIPLLGVHHMQAHALTPLLTEEIPPEFPFLTLLVSGGHTLLVLARGETDFEILATCDDENIGASFDKACRDLRIPYSEGIGGSPGAALESFAQLPTSPPPSRERPNYMFPIPTEGKLIFSFSGLRSALTRLLEKEKVGDMSESRRRELARGFVEAAVGQVEAKITLALKRWKGEELKALVASGGVASNQYLRMRLRHCLDSLGKIGLPLVFPPVSLCTDNAAMIANVGRLRLRRGRIDDLTVMHKAKWSIEDCEADFSNTP
ncbi:glycoprotease [Meredithblackwellia eburnea MCA 4105]